MGRVGECIGRTGWTGGTYPGGDRGRGGEEEEDC